MQTRQNNLPLALRVVAARMAGDFAYPQGISTSLSQEGYRRAAATLSAAFKNLFRNHPDLVEQASEAASAVRMLAQMNDHPLIQEMADDLFPDVYYGNYANRLAGVVAGALLLAADMPDEDEDG